MREKLVEAGYGSHNHDPTRPNVTGSHKVQKHRLPSPEFRVQNFLSFFMAAGNVYCPLWSWFELFSFWKMPSSAKSGRSILAGYTRSPIFQPPSYYATANGLPYVHTRTPLPDASIKSSLNADQRPDSVHYERFMPISYLPDPSPSDSSLELRSTEIHTTTGSSTNKSPNRGKRQSQITGLPQIEAQLLPSLRDTIDKMTRPPSRLAPPVTIVPESSMSRRANRHKRYENGVHYSDFSSNAYDRSMLSRPRRGLIPKTFSPGKYSIKPTASPVLSSLNPEQKSSSYEDSQGTPRPGPVPQKASVATSTLRSVKSLPIRKLSTNPPTAVSSPESRKRTLFRVSAFDHTYVSLLMFCLYT